MKTILILILFFAGFTGCSVHTQEKPASTPSTPAPGSPKDQLCKKWVLIQIVDPIIAPNDASTGTRTSDFKIEDAAEILNLNKDNSYELSWKKDTMGTDRYVEKGTWEMLDTSIQFHPTEQTNETRTYGAQWNIDELTESLLKLRFQTRAGFIKKSYASK